MVAETELFLSNPLPKALAHYSREITDVISEAYSGSVTSRPARPVEGMAGSSGKLRMMMDASANILAGRRSGGPCIQLWPSLGFAEARLWRRSKNLPRHAVIIHDPVPIRQQHGYGALAKAWSSRASRESSPTVIVHSDSAACLVHEILPSHEVVHLPHPILKKQISHQKRGDPVVLVAGQYKPERDIALLSRIGPRLRAQGYRTKIVGVGWPTVAGWEVLDKFVSEDELDRELSGATVNLVAYKNYFQSGIAVRALERGTLTVGALTPFVLNLYRGSQKYLVDADRNGDVDSQYLSAIERVATLPDRREVRSTFDEYRAYVTDRWQRWLAELGMP